MMITTANNKYFTHWRIVGNRYNDYSNGSAPAERAPELVPQTQKPDKCVNYAQVGAGILGTGLGAAQFTEGALEAVIGVGGALETGGGSLLLAGRGVVDVGLSAVAFRDGLSLLQTGFDGVQRGSTFGNIGALVGGENGRTGGEMINAALGIRGLAGAIKSGKAGSSGFLADLTDNVLSTVLPDSMRPCQ